MEKPKFDRNKPHANIGTIGRQTLTPEEIEFTKATWKYITGKDIDIDIKKEDINKGQENENKPKTR